MTDKCLDPTESAGHQKDITRTLISPAYILQNVHNFFPNAIFLDRRYTILAISSNISTSLGYLPEELCGHSISLLQQDEGLVNSLRVKLSGGFFSSECFQLRKKTGTAIDHIISGFYLGILSHNSDMIVLHFDHKAEVKELTAHLQRTREHIDNFIYRTAHDLRGPLATIQGLIFLLNIRTDDSEVDRFTSLIEASCKKLEERLTNLVYLSKVEEEFATPSFALHIDDLETSLRKAIERNTAVDYLEFSIAASSDIISGYNEELIKSVVSNILMYVLSLQQTIPGNIHIAVAELNKRLRITLRARGFEKDPSIEQVLMDVDGTYYVDVLQSSRFTYLFAAQKIVARLNAFIQFRMIDPATQQISLTIPLPDSIL